MNSPVEKGDGFVTFSSLSVSHLYEGYFEVSESAMIEIAAMAAFETAESNSPLAVYPWIVNSQTGELVWTPTPSNTERDGVQASIMDSVLVSPGEYTAFYTTFGPSVNSKGGGAFLGLKPYWTNDPDFWRLSLKEKGELGRVALSTSPSKSVASENSPVWEFVPTSSKREASQMIQVESRSELRFDITAAICGNRCDTIQLYRVPDSTPFWILEEDMTEPAGGADLNRTFEGGVEVEPGIYRIEYEAGRSQYYNAWNANPPWAPEAWGLRMFSGEASQVRIFDPWTDQDPIASLLQAGDDEDLSITFELDKPLSVVVYGMGEMRRGNDRYDYGWIEKEGRSVPLWMMNYEGSKAAGGDDMNRQQMDVLNLEAGTYRLRYISDDSHSYANWNKRKPQFPERWGIVIFAMNPQDVDPTAVRTWADGRVGAASVEVSTIASESIGETIIQQNRLGNDIVVDERMVLDAETSLKIVALGELTRGSSHDYGWISKVGGAGEKVWEMTYQNTVSAGGADRNRRFDGMITLDAGEYQVHFETDFSHSFANFDDDEPRDGADWGIQIFKAKE